MNKQKRPFYRKWWFYIAVIFIGLFLILIGIGIGSSGTGSDNNLADSDKVGNYKIYKVRVKSIRITSDHSWLVSGTTSAPDGAKVVATPYSESNMNYAMVSSESPSLASWEKVNNKKFSVLVDPVGLTNKISPSAGYKTKTSIFAITNYHKPWTSPTISKKIVRKANNFGYTTLTIDTKMANYIAGLGSNKSSSSDNSSSAASESSSSSSSSIFSTTAKTTDLTTGTWTVGTDIQPGWYTITSNGGEGNLTSNDDNLNVILGQTVDDDEGTVDSYRADLKTGETIEISGFTGAHFEAITSRTAVDSGNLSAGYYKVGKDIQPGRYKIQAVEGSGNLMTNDGEVNEILGTTTDADSGQVTNTTVNLVKGQVLQTELESISITKQQ